MTTSTRVSATVLVQADDLYRGFLVMLLRKSFWYTAQLVFSFVLIFALNPRLLSPYTFVLVGFVFFLYLAIFLYRTSAKSIKTNATYQQPINFTFDAAGLEARGNTFFFHNDWCNFTSIIEDSKIFLFCPSTSQMLVVPKRAFSDLSQISALRQILRGSYSGKLSLKS